MNTIGKETCPNCEGRGWNTKYEFHVSTEIIYNVTCKFCGGTGMRDRLREYVISNGFDLVGMSEDKPATDA